MFVESMTKGALIEVKADTPQETIDYLEQVEGAIVVRDGMDEDKREGWMKLNSKSGK